MAAAATTAMYSRVLKKKIGDVFRVGAGGGLCFCGINMYFKNDKFYDDWVMPLFGRMDPETACAVAKKAAKYKLVSEEKLQESRLLVSTQPSRKMELEEKLLQEQDDETDKNLECHELATSKENLFESLSERGMTCDSTTLPSMLFDSEFENDEVVCLDLSVEEENTSSTPDGGGGYGSSGSRTTEGVPMRYLSEAGHLGSDLSCCSSPKLERNCVTPDSPSLSMRVNVASPLRTSKMSLATMIDGTNPAYDRMHVDEDLDVAEEDFAGGCEEEEEVEGEVELKCLQEPRGYERTEADALVENPGDECVSEDVMK